MRNGLIITALLLAASASPGLAAGDAAKGEAVFKKCMACHRVGEGAKNMVGPVLTGIVGRKTGIAEGFSYSALNKAAGEKGLVWTEESIFSYLEDPNVFLKKFLTDSGNADLATGATKMIFKLKDETERNNVIAYLKTFSPPPTQ